MTKIEQQKRKIKKLELKLKDWKSNAETWKFYYKRSQEEVHRLNVIIRKLEKINPILGYYKQEGVKVK
jgi:hypothetical protein